MPDDRDGDGGGDDGNVIYLPRTKTIEVFKGTPKTRRAGRGKPTGDRRSPSAVAVLAAVAVMVGMAVYMGGELLVLAAIAGVLILGAAVARKKRPARQRELRRPRTRTREAPGDRLMELHVWCEFEIDHEPTMIEAVEAVLANLYEEEEREEWRG